MNNAVYKNASIVTGLSVAERGLGFLYRIVLSRLIGAEGLGLYQVANSLYFLLCTLTTGGIPVTLSRMIAKARAERNPDKEKSVLSAGLALCLCIAVPLFALFFLFGKGMPFLFSDERGFEILKILLLGLCFASVCAVLRGYFWGNKKFLTASLLETTEEIVMVLVGVALLSGVASPLDGAKKAAWAATAADIVSCVIAVVCFFATGGRLRKPKKELKPLFTASVPITSVRTSGSLVSSAVAVLLPAMLIRAGLGEREALSLFGVVSGMVMPVLFIPSTLIGSFALVLAPELSADYYQKKDERLRKNILRGLTFSILVACALIPFFFVLGEDMGRIAFSNATAGNVIKNSCLILLPMSLTMISGSMLNSIGFEKQTFRFFFFGSATLLICILLLPAVCGVYAYIVGLGASYAVTALCNLLFLNKKRPFLSKARGQGCVHRLFWAGASVLPLSLFGQLFYALFAKIAGEILCVFFTASAMGIVALLLYFLTGVLPWKRVKALFLYRNRRKKAIFE